MKPIEVAPTGLAAAEWWVDGTRYRTGWNGVGIFRMTAGAYNSELRRHDGITAQVVTLDFILPLDRDQWSEAVTEAMSKLRGAA